MQIRSPLWVHILFLIGICLTTIVGHAAPTHLSDWVQLQYEYSWHHILTNIRLPHMTEAEMQIELEGLGLPPSFSQDLKGHFPGAIIASPGRIGDEVYSHQMWSRDGGITAYNLYELLTLLSHSSPTDHSSLLLPIKNSDTQEWIQLAQDYINLRERHQQVHHPFGGSMGVYTADARPITDVHSWGVPQRDGTAVQVLSFVKMYEWLQSLPPQLEASRPQNFWPVLLRDLEDIALHYKQETFCCWEETRTADTNTERGITNFYTMMMMQAALDRGARLIEKYKPEFNDKAQLFKEKRDHLQSLIEELVSQNSSYILSHIHQTGGHIWDKQSRLDMYVILGALYANSIWETEHTFLPPHHEKVFSTLYHLRQYFNEHYPINQHLPGVLYGRYPEDRYDPSKSVHQRHPGDGGIWPLTTMAAIEVQLQKALHIKKQGFVKIHPDEWEAFEDLLKNYPLSEEITTDREYSEKTSVYRYSLLALTKRAIDDLESLRQRIGGGLEERHSPGPMSEQIHPETGAMVSLPHLTWSYVAFLRVKMVLEKAQNENLLTAQYRTSTSTRALPLRFFHSYRRGPRMCRLLFQ